MTGGWPKSTGWPYERPAALIPENEPEPDRGGKATTQLDC